MSIIQIIERNIRSIVTELTSQSSADLEVSLDHISDFVDNHEYALAYDVIVAIFETGELSVSTRSAIALLELALVMKYKSDAAEDQIFDFRND